jgi:hypothetical protein
MVEKESHKLFGVGSIPTPAKIKKNIGKNIINKIVYYNMNEDKLKEIVAQILWEQNPENPGYEETQELIKKYGKNFLGYTRGKLGKRGKPIIRL